ncbi:hypothetical protein N7447_004052 [Penicillium robsamsonii]|uniref:uncharacterized protein n=1 Tax=Penicillium robsamsonii TaxID=1792511 RepID=UPI0025482E02|nr:uncharacterized protein N7447_004052 [Penicillium robsamsonii]KAJ5827289.1 hypothetical protein N7447_004052 [Penicillium robsamsonii]
MSLINSSSLNSGKHDSPTAVIGGSLDGFFKHIHALASSSETQIASAMHSEISKLRKEINVRDGELKKVQNEVLDIKERKRVAIEEMFAANESEKAKQKDLAAQIKSLYATVDEKEDNIKEYSTKLRGAEQQIADLKSANSQKAAKVSQSATQINTLENNLKEKEKTIDKMKTAGSSLRSMFSSEQKKKEELEAANVTMSKELKAVKSRLERLESFFVQHSAVEEKSM